jgi:1-deoxy-D-xylulose-5-phosphate synthase
MVLPDRFIEQDTQARQLANAGLTARDIVATVLNALGREVTLTAAAD